MGGEGGVARAGVVGVDIEVLCGRESSGVRLACPSSDADHGGHSI